jgi:hypothetical protein
MFEQDELGFAMFEIERPDQVTVQAFHIGV